jgi:hydroxypyruvate isomerase
VFRDSACYDGKALGSGGRRGRFEFCRSVWHDDRTVSPLPPELLMQRRDFLSTTLAAGAAASFATRAAADDAAGQRKFQLKYAPHFGMFRHHAGEDLVDQLTFMHEAGFRALEDNGMRSCSPEDQQRIARTMEQLEMQMGVFVAHGSIGKLTFARKDQAMIDQVLKDCRDSLDVAKRLNAKWMTLVPGNVDENPRDRLEMGYQTANVIELLKRCAEIFEPHGLVMVLEPLNWHANHGGVFLERSDQAYAICKAVDSPSCKILFDIYHQQITEGNLIPNIDLCWDEIGYFQIGDNPGRKEPGTGEINYKNVFAHIHRKMQETDRDFIFGMEHGNARPGKEGEQAVIDAYVAADGF